MSPFPPNSFIITIIYSHSLPLVSVLGKSHPVYFFDFIHPTPMWHFLTLLHSFGYCSSTSPIATSISYSYHYINSLCHTSYPHILFPIFRYVEEAKFFASLGVLWFMQHSSVECQVLHRSFAHCLKTFFFRHFENLKKLPFIRTNALHS